MTSLSLRSVKKGEMVASAHRRLSERRDWAPSQGEMRAACQKESAEQGTKLGWRTAPCSCQPSGSHSCHRRNGARQSCSPWQARREQTDGKGVCDHSPQGHQCHLQTQLCSPQVSEAELWSGLAALGASCGSSCGASLSLQECPSTSWAPLQAASTTAWKPCTATCAGEYQGARLAPALQSCPTLSPPPLL